MNKRQRKKRRRDVVVFGIPSLGKYRAIQNPRNIVIIGDIHEDGGATYRLDKIMHLQAALVSGIGRVVFMGDVINP